MRVSLAQVRLCVRRPPLAREFVKMLLPSVEHLEISKLRTAPDLRFECVGVAPAVEVAALQNSAVTPRDPAARVDSAVSLTHLLPLGTRPHSVAGLEEQRTRDSVAKRPLR